MNVSEMSREQLETLVQQQAQAAQSLDRMNDKMDIAVQKESLTQE